MHRLEQHIYCMLFARVNARKGRSRDRREGSKPNGSVCVSIFGVIISSLDLIRRGDACICYSYVRRMARAEPHSLSPSASCHHGAVYVQHFAQVLRLANLYRDYCMLTRSRALIDFVRRATRLAAAPRHVFISS